MQVITPQQRAARQAELDQPKIDRLFKRAEKGDKMAVIVLQSEYGFDLDYNPGIDDGEHPKEQE